jgi:hypothetical protein
MKRGALKRSALKPGAKSLERGSTFASRGNLQRVSLPRTVALHNPPPRRSELPGARGWTQRVFTLYGRACVVCGGPATEAHHVVPRQVILAARHLTQADRELLAYDARVCGRGTSRACHANHEAAAHRIPFDRLPAGAVEWAVEHGFRGRVMDRRVYPREAS